MSPRLPCIMDSQNIADRMVEAVRHQTEEDTYLLIFWIACADDPGELVHRALPQALRSESYDVISAFDSAIIMIPTFRGFDLRAAVAAMRLPKRPLVRKN